MNPLAPHVMAHRWKLQGWETSGPQRYFDNIFTWEAPWDIPRVTDTKEPLKSSEIMTVKAFPLKTLTIFHGICGVPM